VNLADISARQKISLTYLEQLFGKLRKKGLVESIRGPGGGYRLALNADDITPAHVIYAVDEPIDATLCGGQQINRYEKGHVSPREITILALADALEIDPDSLFVEE